MGNITVLLNTYGYIVLFISLLLELIALPLPGEILMSYCGYLIYQGQLKYIFSIILSALGAICGITISYFIGKTLGIKFFEKYGKYVHLTPERLKKVDSWFEKYGNKLLIIAYFIPGVRHITGYVSGITNISYKKFAINAYLGSFLWTTTFITLGKILGSSWDNFHKYAIKYLIIGVAILIIVVGCVYGYKVYRSRIAAYAYKKAGTIVAAYNSLGKIKLLIAFLIILYIALVAFSFGFAEDYLSKELIIFDDVITFIIGNMFSISSIKFIKIVNKLSTISPIVIICASIIFLTAWVILNKKYELKNISFILCTIVGGYILVDVINYIFSKVNINVSGILDYSFPSKDIFILSVVLATVIYYIIKFSKNTLIKNTVIIVLLLIRFCIGVSDIYLGIQKPSGVIAGYLFASLWIILNIFILELSILFTKVEKIIN